MKTVKVVLVAILMAFVAFGFAQNEVRPEVEKPVPTIVSILTIQSALQIPGMESAMYSQLTTEFLKADKQIYIVRIKFRNRIYFIYGEYRDWTSFFKIHPLPIKELD
ncbi:MAG: hypothetical protein R2764_03235 [Bacteroidales bacterium]